MSRDWTLALAITALAVAAIALPAPWGVVTGTAALALVLALVWRTRQQPVVVTGAIMVALAVVPAVGYLAVKDESVFGPWLVGMPFIALLVVAASVALMLARRRWNR